jgi:hypothetical protein
MEGIESDFKLGVGRVIACLDRVASLGPCFCPRFLQVLSEVLSEVLSLSTITLN